MRKPIATKQIIRLKVNGETYEVAVNPNRTLLDCIREDIGLTGTKKGCDSGDCGSCTVIMDGKVVNSCLVLAIEAMDREILTIEGLAGKDGLHPLQEAFIEYGAVQCGFCTSGVILAAKYLLDHNPNPTERDKVGYRWQPLPVHWLCQDSGGHSGCCQKDVTGPGLAHYRRVLRKKGEGAR